MIGKVIMVVLGIVVGLALLPVVIEMVDDLTGVGGRLEGETLGTLVDLLPVFLILGIVIAVVAVIKFRR